MQMIESEAEARTKNDFDILRRMEKELDSTPNLPATEKREMKSGSSNRRVNMMIADQNSKADQIFNDESAIGSPAAKSKSATDLKVDEAASDEEAPPEVDMLEFEKIAR
jgi:hypothetical protein